MKAGRCGSVSLWLWQRDRAGCRGWMVTDAPAGAGAQRTVLLSPVTALRYRAHTNSARSKENHLLLKQGSSPALTSSRVPQANSELLQGCKLALAKCPPLPPPHISRVTPDGWETLSWSYESPGQQMGTGGDFMQGRGQRKREQTSPDF